MPTIPWTSEQAGFWARKGAADRKARLKRLADREQILDKLIAQAGDNLAKQPAQPIAQPATGDTDIYLISRLSQVRSQLASLSKRMDEACNAPEIDAKALFALSGSYRQVQEMEQSLAGRPNPGSLRPVAPRRAVAVFTPPADS